MEEDNNTTTKKDENVKENKDIDNVKKDTEEINIKVTNKKSKKLLCIAGAMVLIIILVLIFVIIYISGIQKVSDNNQVKAFIIRDGDTYYSIAERLKEENLIKSEFIYKLYLKLNAPKESLKSGAHELKENMNVEEIIDEISKVTYKKGEMVTFKEGLNIRKIAKIIEDKTSNSQEDVYEVLNNEEYLNSLISKYWFITDEIKNKDIYYSLEGYLYPNTYEFFVDEVTIEEIFERMLDETEKKLEPYKKAIENSEYSVHEILTLASIVELEGLSKDDRSKVAGVFYNRLKAEWPLGSDVTTYYGAKVDMSERDLYMSEINDKNPYNTRSNSLAGKLPVGPVCNPSVSAIEAVLYPADTDYFYFVADKNGKTYFSKTSAEHEQTIERLKENNLWFTYDN